MLIVVDSSSEKDNAEAQSGLRHAEKCRIVILAADGQRIASAARMIAVFSALLCVLRVSALSLEK
jgi:hypothetical protein